MAFYTDSVEIPKPRTLRKESAIGSTLLFIGVAAAILSSLAVFKIIKIFTGSPVKETSTNA